MRTHMIQQYKKLKNSPVRSPSPDYACRNHSGKTGVPLEDGSFPSNTFTKNSTAHFPSIPIEILIKRRTSEIENVNPIGRSDDTKKNVNNSTAIYNSGMHKIWPLPEVSDFGTEALPENKTSMADMLRRIEEIYRLVNSNTSESEFYEPLSWAEKLDSIRKQVVKLMSDRKSLHFTASHKHINDTNNSLALPRHTHTQQVSNQSWNNSPTRPQVEESFCIFQMNELTVENNKLKRQLTSIRLLLIENEQKVKNLKNSSINAGNNCSDQTLEDSCGNYSVYQFLREKISYLQNQLENQITKFTKMSDEKNKQIIALKEKIGQTSEMLKNQMQRSRKLLSDYKEEASQIRSRPELTTNNDPNFNTPGVSLKTEVEDSHYNPVGQRKGLPWEKEEILSIQDNEHCESSLYSEAERVEWQQLMPNRQLALAIQNIKNYYEQIIIKNSSKYHEVLTSMQSQLTELRNFIQQQDIESDSQHHTCQKCRQTRQTTLKNQLRVTDLDMEIGLLRRKVEEEKKQNAKLRDLLQMAVTQQTDSKNNRVKIKGRKLEKVSKKSVKSSDCHSREGLESLQASQHSENTNSKKQVDFQPYLDGGKCPANG